MDGEDALLHGGHVVILEVDDPLGMLDDGGCVGSEEVLDGVAGVRGRDLRGRAGVGIHPESGRLLPLGQRGAIEGELLLVRGIAENFVNFRVQSRFKIHDSEN